MRNDGAEQLRLMELRWLLISAAVLINYLPATQMFLYLGESVDLFDFVCRSTEMDGAARRNIFFFCWPALKGRGGERERVVPVFVIVSRPPCHIVAVPNVTAGVTLKEHSALLLVATCCRLSRRPGFVSVTFEFLETAGGVGPTQIFENIEIDLLLSRL